MSNDYFLLHRALQIQRLRSGAGDIAIQIPDRRSRDRSNEVLVNVCTAIEAIEKLPLGDTPHKKGLLSWLRLPRLLGGKDEVGDSDAESTSALMLTTEQRDLLEKFEEDLVRLVMDDDDEAATVAVRIMQAIWADQAFFQRLKTAGDAQRRIPLRIPVSHVVQFVYGRRLAHGRRPSTLLRVRATDPLHVPRRCPAGRLGSQGGTARHHDVSVHRVPEPQRRILIQRLMDLSCPKAEFRFDYLEPLSQLREQSASAAMFQQLLQDYLIVESCLRPQPISNGYKLARDATIYREIPDRVAVRIRALEADPTQRKAYCRLLHRIATIHLEANGLEPTWSAVFNRNPEHVDDLLEIIAPDDPSMGVLPRDVQKIVARIVDKQGLPIDAPNLDTIRRLAHDLASRMDDLDPQTIKFLEVEFLDKATNRKALLESVNLPDKRTRLAAQLAAHARKVSDRDRLFDLLVLASVFDPSIERASLDRIKLSVRVLRMAQENASIGKKELDDLMADIVQNLPESIRYLDSPLQAAGTKSDRLAKLYLALYEEREVYRHSGTVANFGVTRASYGNLSRLAEELDS